jgi:hypothetical protein
MSAKSERKKRIKTQKQAEYIAQELERREQQERENMLWYPAADDLPLLHIPKDVRPQLRERLAPWLAKLTHLGGDTERVGVQQGRCYRVAQALVLTAKDPDVKYVEGFWGCGASHAWTTVDGYRVDLVQEFYTWRDGKENERMYEPFEEFTEQQLRNVMEDQGYSDTSVRYYETRNELVSFGIVHQRWLDDGNEVKEHRCHDIAYVCRCTDRSQMCAGWEDCECECEAAMAPAFKRITERLQAQRLAA